MTSTEMAAHVERARAAAPIRGVAAHRAVAARAVGGQQLPTELRVEPAAGLAGSEWVSSIGARADAVVLYLHSGGFVAGSPALCRLFAGRVSAATGTRFLVPAYRLAPEHPFPAALDDALSAYRRLLEARDPTRLAVGGASAGGGLALSLLLRARAEGLPMPAAAFLVSPWLDLSLSSRSMLDADSTDPLNSVEYLRLLAEVYRAGAPAEDPLISPVGADLRGLPPLHVEVGAPERLLDDALALVQCVAGLGGSIALSVVEGALHTFPHGAPDTPEAEAAVARVALHLRAHLELA